MLRLETDALLALLYQEPPRLTRLEPDVVFPLYSLSLLYFLDLKPKKFQILTVSLTGEYFTKCFFAAFRAALKAFGYFT